MYPAAVLKKLEILDKASDYPSDREAAKHIGVDRTTIIKYRSRLRLTSRTDLITSLQGKRGRKPRRSVGRNPHVLARWIQGENPDWGAKKISSSMRKLGHRVTEEEVEDYCKCEPNLSPGKNALLEDLDQATELMALNGFTQHPVRSLANLNNLCVRQAHTILQRIDLLEALGWEDGIDVQLLKTQARTDLAFAKKIRSLIGSIQGKGIRLTEDELDDSFLEAIRTFRWQLPQSVTGIDLSQTRSDV